MRKLNSTAEFDQEIIIILEPPETSVVSLQVLSKLMEVAQIW